MKSNDTTERPKRILTSIAERDRGLHYITRCDDQRGTHGWNVRPPGRKRDRFFSDARNGGRTKALDAALAWRDAEGPVGNPAAKSRDYIYTVSCNENVTGYYVRIARKGKVFQAYHSAKRYGSLKAARSAAESFRDSALAKLSK